MSSLRAIPQLAQALEKRYPGVRVTSAVLVEGDNGSMQQLEFEAPRAVLVERGLILPNGQHGEYFNDYGTRLRVSRTRDGLTRVIHQEYSVGLDLSSYRSNPGRGKTRDV